MVTHGLSRGCSVRVDPWRNCSSLVPWFAFGDVNNVEEFLRGELWPCWAGQRTWCCAGAEANGCSPRVVCIPGAWEKQILDREELLLCRLRYVCADCPAGLGSGADSCFFLPSVYLYVFG